MKRIQKLLAQVSEECELYLSRPGHLHSQEGFMECMEALKNVKDMEN